MVLVQKYTRAYLIQCALLRPKTRATCMTKFCEKWLTNDLTRSRLKYQYAYHIHTQCPDFHLFHSTLSHFRATAQFWEKCTKWPQNCLDMFKVKSIHTYVTYIHTDQFFFYFPVGAFLSYGPILDKYTK